MCKSLANYSKLRSTIHLYGCVIDINDLLNWLPFRDRTWSIRDEYPCVLEIDIDHSNMSPKKGFLVVAWPPDYG